MFWLKLLIPLLYLGLAIYLPTRLHRPSYFAYDVLLFILPAFLLFFANRNWIREKRLGWPIVVSLVFGTMTSYFFEFIAMGMNVWSFGSPELYIWPKIHSLPIEEFLFYWGAAPACLFLYLYYFRIFESKIRAMALPIDSVWMEMALPFLLITAQLHAMLKNRRVVSFPALSALVLVFFIGTGYVEYNAIKARDWIYNDAVMWNIKPWGIPLEELLIYYWLGPTFIVLLFHFLDLRPKIVFTSEKPGLDGSGHKKAIGLDGDAD